MNTLTQISMIMDWQTAFDDVLSASGCGLATLKSYRQDIAHFAAWFEAANGVPFSPDQITGVDLRAYRASALDAKTAPATFNRRRAALRRLCAWAFAAGYVSYDPFQGVEKIDTVELPPRWLSEPELHQLMRAIEQAVNGATTEFWRWQAARDAALVALMLHAGLREAEVCALDLDDLQIGERKGRIFVQRGKGDKRRELPLNNECRRALRHWLQVSGIQAGAVFIGKAGERISPRLVQLRIAALRQAAGLDDDVTPHALRHTFAKRLLDSGAPLTVVSRLLGHARLETTARYVQPGWGDFEKAVEKL